MSEVLTLTVNEIRDYDFAKLHKIVNSPGFELKVESTDNKAIETVARIMKMTGTTRTLTIQNMIAMGMLK